MIRTRMRIGILGSGLMGGKLGTIFGRAGHEIVFSYSRDDRKLERLARAAGRTARAGTPGDAARRSDVLLLAVHWSRLDDVLDRAGSLAGKVVVTCSLPMNADDTELVVAHTSSGAEALAGRIPNARVVSAFGTVPSEVLFDVFASRRRKTVRPSLVYCGDDRSADGGPADPGRGLRSGRCRAALDRTPHGAVHAPRRPPRIRGEGRPASDLPVRALRQATEEAGPVMDLDRWDSFYVIVGSAAGALIGLQFVVTALVAERPVRRTAEEAGAAFATPQIVHFVAAFVLSALLRAPWQGIAKPSLIWGLIGGAGAVYARSSPAACAGRTPIARSSKTGSFTPYFRSPHMRSSPRPRSKRARIRALRSSASPAR